LRAGASAPKAAGRSANRGLLTSRGKRIRGTRVVSPCFPGDPGSGAA
jgi:hypothetical protein